MTRKWRHNAACAAIIACTLPPACKAEGAEAVNTLAARMRTIAESIKLPVGSEAGGIGGVVLQPPGEFGISVTARADAVALKHPQNPAVSEIPAAGSVGLRHSAPPAAASARLQLTGLPAGSIKRQTGAMPSLSFDPNAVVPPKLPEVASGNYRIAASPAPGRSIPDIGLPDITPPFVPKPTAPAAPCVLSASWIADCGIPAGLARDSSAKMVVEGLLDGSLDPSDAQWRPHLAHLMASPESVASYDTLYKLFIAGCGSGSESEKIEVAEKWASRYDSGKYAGEIAFSAARRCFNSGDYAGASSLCDTIIKVNPGLAVRAMLLKALASAYAGNATLAQSIIIEAKNKYPDSPEMPEVRYMEAWMALQAAREDDAAAILNGILRDTPDAPAAEKARRILATLEGNR